MEIIESPYSTDNVINIIIRHADKWQKGGAKLKLGVQLLQATRKK